MEGSWLRLILYNLPRNLGRMQKLPDALDYWNSAGLFRQRLSCSRNQFAESMSTSIRNILLFQP
jgi:hypothetical protein